MSVLSSAGLKHISVTNDYRVGDTYAALDPWGDDPASHLKTYASVDGKPQHTAHLTTSGREGPCCAAVLLGPETVCCCAAWP